ncbi:MAG: hypothetical protein GY807_15720 [Gammaproteobacteria bacterium]|nr:hypothetical protein [Gammaproteobacteria bacterium]
MNDNRCFIPSRRSGGTVWDLFERSDVLPGDPIGPVTSARFYQGTGPGEGVLVEKFTTPFTGVEPGGMTLSGSLGTVVLGANAPAGQMMVFANYPYSTGTATDTSIPTGTAITSVKWI